MRSCDLNIEHFNSFLTRKITLMAFFFFAVLQISLLCFFVGSGLCHCGKPEN